MCLTSLATIDWPGPGHLTWDFHVGTVGSRLCSMIVGIELKGHEAVRAEVFKEKNLVTLSLSHSHIQI